MAAPPASVAAVRLAVRRDLADLPADALVLVAASGGPDSTALAAATAFVAPRLGLRAGLLTVDQGWTPDSATRAREVADAGQILGLAPTRVLAAHAPRQEGPARNARRSALLGCARELGAGAVLLGHSLDDQAETVLLRLARGSGARSLAGMPARDGLLRRPLLGLRRDQLRESCAALGLSFWDDPANADPAFLRSRVRSELLPALEAVLGPGAVPALARSADLLRDDADALEGLADELGPPDDELATDVLAALPRALRSRVLRRAAIHAGSPPTDLSAAHVTALDELVVTWRGQGPIPLPGGVCAARRGGRITFVPQPALSRRSAPSPDDAQLDRPRS